MTTAHSKTALLHLPIDEPAKFPQFHWPISINRWERIFSFSLKTTAAVLTIHLRLPFPFPFLSFLFQFPFPVDLDQFQELLSSVDF